MEVKPGYQPTEVGVIPDDWRLISVSRVGDTKRGAGSQYIKYRASGGVRLIRINDFFEDTPVFVEPTDAIKRYLIHERDLLFAGTGASAGASYLPDADWIGLPHSYNAPRIRISESYSKEYVLFSLQSSYVLKQQKAWFVGAAQPFLDTKAISNLLLAIPPTLSEQSAIAGALSDVDALIGAQDQLIAKKRDLKQAAMQQLLTGQKRLPGFQGEWQVKTLGDLFTFGGGYSASRDQLSQEGYCYLHYGDIHKSSKTFIDVRSEYQDIPKLDITLHRVSPVSLLQDGDVVFVDASEDDEGTSRHVVVVNKKKTPFISGLHTIVAKSKTNELDHQFRRYCFQTTAIKRQFYFYAVGTKVSGISKANITKLTLPVPARPEQIAIAEVLTDMDAELATLEQRRDKTRALKQGMMQELLTGKTRLVDSPRSYD
jgi:type I restriction enzyme, S subunit